MQRITMLRPEADGRPNDKFRVKQIAGTLAVLVRLGGSSYDWLNVLSYPGKREMITTILEVQSVLDNIRLKLQRDLD